MKIRRLLTLLLLIGYTVAYSQTDSHSEDDHSQDTHQTDEQSDDHADEHGGSHDECAFHHEQDPENFNPQEIAFHHIADANVYSIGPLQLPLPCILYSKESGLEVFLSNKFDFKRLGHGTGHKAYNRYVLDGGAVKRITDPSFPSGSVELEGFKHKSEMVDGKEKEIAFVCYGGKEYRLDQKSTLDGGMFGGGITSFSDFSITKNVTAMILVTLFLMWMFLAIARSYKKREGKAPKGLQGFIEPVFAFMNDEVVEPFLGNKSAKYLPFIMALFFFILALNLFGQIPFFGGANVTGSLSVTLVLAVLTFIVTNISGKKDYWAHIFWMPGVPAWVKTILTPVEILGLFIKPLTLMLRLFANITAGHIVVIIFVSLIFIFGKVGTVPAAGYGAAVGSTLLTLFMMAIELLVAFIQAFVFAILAASYIGAAVEEHHH
jgi:F-type H+-transporting ATPase subunit a